jgi:hypothetical protein
MNKYALWIIIGLLLLFGGWSLRIQFVVILQDLPFLGIGFLLGWYFRSRWRP